MGREGLMELFNHEFDRWEIKLLPEAIESDEVWMIVKRGWTIWCRFGSDENSEYLDYYASHRMTSDRHVRLYPDGRRESLETLSEFFSYPKDATPEEIVYKKAEFNAYNQAVSKMLNEKGFRLTKDAHGSAIVNRYLLTTLEEER